MYKIETTGQIENSYMNAIKVASQLNSKVIEVATGLVRWEPAATVSAKRMRAYSEGAQAHKAYELLKGK